MKKNLATFGAEKRKELILKTNKGSSEPRYNISNEYTIEDSKKGGEGTGSAVSHQHDFDTSSGGDKTDKEQRKIQSLYATPGQTRYTPENGYLSESGNPIVSIDGAVEGQYIVD